MDIQIIGKVIGQARRWQNISQYDLAKKAKVTVGLIYRLEYGRIVDVHCNKLERILVVLGIPFNRFSLVTGKEEPSPYECQNRSYPLSGDLAPGLTLQEIQARLSNELEDQEDEPSPFIDYGREDNKDE